MSFFQQLIQQFHNIFKGLSTGRKVAFFLILAASIAVLITLTIISQRVNYDVLFSSLSPQDAGVIISKLKEQKIPYRVSASGTSILVPSEKVYETRMGLASEGLPQGGGVGFEIFDQTKLGMTEFVQNVNYQRALQGELARTINQIDKVEQSRIHVVTPQKSLFVEDQKEVSASIVLKVMPGAKLTQNQVQGIVHLVASSVEGLSPEKITIMDNHGQILAGGTEESRPTQLTNSQAEIKRALEKDMEEGIESMLEKAVGRGKALARVFLNLDFKQTEKTEEKYDPDSLAIRSEQNLDEKSSGSSTIPRGVPGVQSNISGNVGASGTTGSPSKFQRKNQTVNYEISKTTSHIIEPVGEIIKCSVAVIIDGTYEVSKGNEGKEEKQYIPRSGEEMERFTNIVKMAVGYNADRGDQVEVVNMPFDNTTLIEDEVSKEPTFRKLWFPIIRFGIILLAVIMLFFVILRPLMRWLTTQRGEFEAGHNLPRTVGELEAEMGDVRGGEEVLSRKEKAMELANNDPERTAQLIRGWLNEGK